MSAVGITTADTGLTVDEIFNCAIAQDDLEHKMSVMFRVRRELEELIDLKENDEIRAFNHFTPEFKAYLTKLNEQFTTKPATLER